MLDITMRAVSQATGYAVEDLATVLDGVARADGHEHWEYRDRSGMRHEHVPEADDLGDVAGWYLDWPECPRPEILCVALARLLDEMCPDRRYQDGASHVRSSERDGRPTYLTGRGYRGSATPWGDR